MRPSLSQVVLQTIFMALILVQYYSNQQLSGGAQTFRQDKEGTLSYFVGQNPKYPKDTGFGLKYWRDVRFDTSNIFIENTVAMWMGWVSFEDKDGNITKVDKSWGYKKDSKGNLKIILHHSSLPYKD